MMLMPARARFRIFLSSTSEDLTEYRDRVAEAIETLELQPGRMETFGAKPKTPLDTCRKEVAKADALVVMVAHRYGWVPGDNGDKSITWHEVEAALDTGKPVFAFVVDPEYTWEGPQEQDRLTAETSDAEALEILAAVRALKRFKEYLDERITRATFTTADDPAAKVTASLLPWLLENLPGLQDGAPQGTAAPQEAPQDAELDAYLPVFLPLRRLAKGDLSEPLSALAGAVLAEISGDQLPSALAERLWSLGRLLLLLDGLDEIADDTRRAEVASYLDWQLGSGTG